MYESYFYTVVWLFLCILLKALTEPNKYGRRYASAVERIMLDLSLLQHKQARDQKGLPVEEVDRWCGFESSNFRLRCLTADRLIAADGQNMLR